MGKYIALTVDDGTEMRAYTARPTGWGPGGRAILVFQEAFGVNQHIREVADRLAGEGYLAIAPELYHRTAPGFEGDYTDFAAVMPQMKAMTGAGQDADIRAAYGWVGSEGAERVAAVGFCLGGRMAVRAASEVKLNAAASFYGGDLPGLADRVGAITAPLLIVWGDKDKHIPPVQRAAFADLLRGAGKAFVECTFSEADHGFFNDHRTSYHARSAETAWGMLKEVISNKQAAISNKQ